MRFSWKKALGAVSIVLGGFFGTQLTPDESNIYSNAVIALLAVLSTLVRKKED